MEIKDNKDKKSYSRYSHGVFFQSHKGKLVSTSVGSSYDDFLISLNAVPSKEGRVPPYCANRPDTISNIFYETPGYWWYPMQYNSFTDPFEDLNPGDKILIPELL